MSILIENMGHEKYLVLLVGFFLKKFIEVSFFTKCHVVHLGKKDKSHRDYHGLVK